MSFFDNARQSNFVKPQDKQENVSRFAAYYLDRLSVADAPSLAERTVTLLARSPASPVARSMLAAMRDYQGLDIRCELIFAQLQPAELMSDWMDASLLRGGRASVIEIAWARHPALSDAHEQLVLGTVLSWSGDSMRRDPETRDAFETFDCFNAVAARRASLSFRALWAKTEPVAVVRPTEPRLIAGQLPHDVLSQAHERTLPDPGGATASTRH